MLSSGDYARLATLLIIAGFAFVGNTLMLVAGVKNRRLRKFQNSFIFNMALADLLQAVCIMPTAFVSVYRGSEWAFGRLACEAMGALKMSFTLTSVFSLAGISLQRYLFVVKHSERVNTPLSALVAILLVWVASILLAITPFFGWGVFGYEQGKEVCTVLFHVVPSQTLTITVLGLIINIGVMIVCYYYIYKTMRHYSDVRNRSCSTIDRSPRSSSNEESTVLEHHVETNNKVENNGLLSTLLKRSTSIVGAKRWMVNRVHRPSASKRFKITSKEFRLLKTIGVVIVAFLCCWAPYVIFNVLRSFNVTSNNDNVDSVTMWLGFLNSALNPLLYGLLNPQFRVAIKKALLCK